MPRRKSEIPTIEKHFWLPQDLVAQVELRLFSHAEGRVPYNAWPRFLVPLIRSELDRANQDTTYSEFLAARHDPLRVLTMLFETLGYPKIAKFLRTEQTEQENQGGTDRHIPAAPPRPDRLLPEQGSPRPANAGRLQDDSEANALREDERSADSSLLK